MNKSFKQYCVLSVFLIALLVIFLPEWMNNQNDFSVEENKKLPKKPAVPQQDKIRENNIFSSDLPFEPSTNLDNLKKDKK